MLAPPPPRAAVLRRALARAGQAGWALWGRGMGFHTKADGTPVTAADLAAEAEIVTALRADFPGDAIVTEESGGQRGPGAWWAVDPIDGTSSFIEGLGHWGPTVARVVPDSGGPRVDCGALLLPRLDEYYYVETGSGAGGWFNGERLAPLGSRESCRTVYLPSRFHAYFNLAYAGKTRCIGGTAAHLALVARGAAEGVIVAPGWSLLDTAAGLALIAVLGGRAASLRTGEPLDPFSHEGEPFVAGTPGVVEALLRPGAVSLREQDP